MSGAQKSQAAQTLRIGTRASALALWQARHLESLIRALPGAPPVELVPITTTGDLRADIPLWAVRGRAFFTKEIDRALLEERIDIAVHSLKDLPTAMEPGLALAAVLMREDPRDALVSGTGASLSQLPRGARVGTSSLRRRAFLTRVRPDLTLLELRGNVPTRLERLERGDYDAIVLAAAGLKRLGLEQRITEYLSPEQFPPAVSQGAIGICTRADDRHACEWLRPLEDPPTRLATTAERALLEHIEGGCQVPLGALATVTGTGIHLHAAVCALDGSQLLSARGDAQPSHAEAAALGLRLATELLAKGAASLIAAERALQGRAEAP
ncbi:MAG: hydroxymethylbilane synthase [Gammaproteobacteria bacterium]|nr:hydroxymethylbilane synthase [Gammaproteobacteria bacterium]MDE2261109.1 hydroxymethylbilane synthase [Gammaproteobacteria bacterium]